MKLPIGKFLIALLLILSHPNVHASPRPHKMRDTATLLTKALLRDHEAQATFSWMRNAHRDAFFGWVRAASSEIEQAQRVREAVNMLAGRDPIRRN
jgi:hypothetical protein